MPGNTVTYRSHRATDAAAVASFFASASAIEPSIEAVSETDWEYFTTRLFNHGAKDFVVAESDGAIVAILTSTTKHDDCVGHIRHFRIIVHPHNRRRGIASALLGILNTQDDGEVTQQGNSIGKWVAGAAFAERFGFRPVHTELLMKCTARAFATSKNDGVRLRLFLTEDCRDWARLSNDAYRDTGNFIPVTPESVAHDAEADGFNLWVAEQGGRMIGFCHTYTETHAGILNSLVVDPNVRGKGIGRMLLHAAMNTLYEQGKAEIELNVDADNPTAIGLYTSVGFTQYDSMSLLRRVQKKVPKPGGFGT